MTENILDIRRLAEMPKTVGGQQLFIFVPLANAYEPGIASFSSQDFTVTGRSAMVTINTKKFVTLTKLAQELDKKVDKTTKINNKSLDKDIVIYASDVPMSANDSTSVLAKFGLVDAKIAKLEQDTTAVYRYRGSVNTYADLLSIWDSKIGTGSKKPRVGDTYDVKSLNMNYAFVDEVSATAPNGWDALGQLFVLTPATPNKIGGVKPDDMTIGVKEDGTIYAKPATNDQPGIVQPDGETMFIKNGKLSTNPNTDDRAYIQSLFDLYFKSVDYVFAGINPELELLENPVQVVINSEGRGYVNLDYPLDLVEGKNYHIKATIGKLDGSVEEYERDIKAQRIDIDQPICLLDYSDQKIIYVIDKAKSTPTGGTEADENASTVMAGDDGDTKVWSYVTFTSIVQKEVNTNLLKEPIIATRDNPFHTLNYPLGLEVGKSYNITFKLLGVDGTETEKIITTAAIDVGEESPSMKGVKSLQFADNENETFAGQIIDGAYLDSEGEPVLDSNKSLVGVFELDNTVLTSITFTSIVQKEATSVNLLKEPIVVTQEEINAGGYDGVQKTLNKAIGLEIGKIYDLTIVQNGVETIVPASAIDGKSYSETPVSFPYLGTRILNPSFDMEICDGVDMSSEPVVLADKAFIYFYCDTDDGAFELTSIKEHANLEDWSIPLVVTIDNPQEIYYYKYYNKSGTLFTSAGQTVKVTGSLVVNGQAKPFEAENTTRGDTGAYYVRCNITELDKSFIIADGAYSEAFSGAFPASYMTLEIDNTFPTGSPMSELRIDSITVT